MRKSNRKLREVKQEVTVSDLPQGQELFEPAVVQRYQRRSPMLDRQFRDLYREGLATRDFEPCFRLLLGETATLSPSTISRLTKEYQREIYQARSRKEAVDLTGKLAAEWKARYPRASECLTKDIETMFTYFDFPKQHWIHLKTSNPIESAFAPVRLRTNAAKRLRTAAGALYLVYKLIERYSRSWRRINAPEKLLEIKLEGEERILKKAA